MNLFTFEITKWRVTINIVKPIKNDNIKISKLY